MSTSDVVVTVDPVDRARVAGAPRDVLRVVHARQTGSYVEATPLADRSLRFGDITDS